MPEEERSGPEKPADCPRVEIDAAESLLAPQGVRRLVQPLVWFGPAAIASSVSIGAGETIVVVGTGAWSEYQLLWLVTLAVAVKGFGVTYLLGRHTALTGEPLVARLLRLPGPRGWILLVTLGVELAAAGPVYAVIARPCGYLLHFLVQEYLPSYGSEVFWQNLLASLFLAGALALACGSTYRSFERQQVLICTVLVAGTVAGTVLVQPSVRSMIQGLIPQFPLAPTWGPEHLKTYGLAYALELATVFGYVGNTVMGYAVYPSWVMVRGWGLAGLRNADEIRRFVMVIGCYSYLPTDSYQAGAIRRLLTPLRWDVCLGAVVLWVVTAAFLSAGAAVLYPLQQPVEPLRLLTEQRHVWYNISPYLVPVYYVTVLAALWGTLNALPEVWARVSHELLTAVYPNRQVGRSTVQSAVVAVIVVSSMTLIWSGSELRLLMALTAFLTCNAGVALLASAALYANFNLPAAYRLKPFSLGLAFLAVAILWVATLLGGLELGWRLVR
jgi:hypothetical protein